MVEEGLTEATRHRPLTTHDFPAPCLPGLDDHILVFLSDTSSYKIWDVSVRSTLRLVFCRNGAVIFVSDTTLPLFGDRCGVRAGVNRGTAEEVDVIFKYDRSGDGSVEPFSFGGDSTWLFRSLRPLSGELTICPFDSGSRYLVSVPNRRSTG